MHILQKNVPLQNGAKSSANKRLLGNKVPVLLEWPSGVKLCWMAIARSLSSCALLHRRRKSVLDRCQCSSRSLPPSGVYRRGRHVDRSLVNIRLSSLTDDLHSQRKVLQLFK